MNITFEHIKNIVLMSIGVIYFALLFIWTMAELYYGSLGIFGLIIFAISFFYIYLMLSGIRYIRKDIKSLKEKNENTI